MDDAVVAILLLAAMVPVALLAVGGETRLAALEAGRVRAQTLADAVGVHAGLLVTGRITPEEFRDRVYASVGAASADGWVAYVCVEMVAPDGTVVNRTCIPGQPPSSGFNLTASAEVRASPTSCVLAPATDRIPTGSDGLGVRVPIRAACSGGAGPINGTCWLVAQTVGGGMTQEAPGVSRRNVKVTAEDVGAESSLGQAWARCLSPWGEMTSPEVAIWAGNYSGWAEAWVQPLLVDLGGEATLRAVAHNEWGSVGWSGWTVTSPGGWVVASGGGLCDWERLTPDDWSWIPGLYLLEQTGTVFVQEPDGILARTFVSRAAFFVRPYTMRIMVILIPP
ncbi:MAG: hypothetical protein QI223_06105 [Candidatus Korarchaeota archaeon]|nr:hypothetical protein [Candidatus Korarchaeota archaeon]